MSSYSNIAKLASVDIDMLVEFGYALNRLRLQGRQVREAGETPKILDLVREKVGAKESEFRAVMEEMIGLLEAFSQRVKGESGDLIEELPSEVQAPMKKVLSRLLKAGAFSNDYGIKRYDWAIEKEIAVSNGKKTDENIVVFEVKSNTRESSDKLKLRIDASQFLKLHETMSKLRETTLTLLN